MSKREEPPVGIRSAAVLVGTLAIFLACAGIWALYRYGFNWGALSLTLSMAGLGSDLLIAGFTGRKSIAIELLIWIRP
jgi:hypothetical protein